MHPEIKKFWEDAGYGITSVFLWDPNRNDIKAWHKHKLPIFAHHEIIARYFEIEGKLEMRYFLNPFDGNKYTEEEMLRIVRLKAFL